MAKILIIPDVHGRTFWKQAYHYVDEVDEVIFLGDYLDPYPFERISNEDAIENFKEIIKFKKEHSKVTLLLGNHDLHYLQPFTNEWGCRKIRDHISEIEKLFNKNLHHFQIIRIIDNYLFSHAGVLKEWFEVITDERPIGSSMVYSESRKLSSTAKQLLTIQFTENHINSLLSHTVGRDALMMISRERGGRDKYGSCVWADVSELLFYDNKLDFYQIFSHTLIFPDLDTYYKDDRMAMLDCRKCFMLTTETKELNEMG